MPRKKISIRERKLRVRDAEFAHGQSMRRTLELRSSPVTKTDDAQIGETIILWRKVLRLRRELKLARA